ncbi:PhzF family phenazine biosynthesis protein [Gilvimarinus sp. F26214L]|uniref:PhzF family phenazine biosynthesis protein n=1 Tax=Gilvimarinus sp. DZF01 TaxID=3461371 RepID=UPI004045CE3A
MRYHYYICDVFTRHRFGGNQLAVLPKADGLSDAQMQQIAREFNFSETTFVLPARSSGHRQIRIFTPAQEVPFAGHPNVGTAFVLASTGDVAVANGGELVFEEEAGLVPVRVEQGEAGLVHCELLAPEALQLGPTVAAESVAAVMSLERDDVVLATHAPQVASVGLPFLFVEVRDAETLARARCNLQALKDLESPSHMIHVYTRSDDEFQIRSRMFAPLSGVPEDPATGSANVALGALLAHYHPQDDADLHWTVAQGVEMGRPSVLHVKALKQDGDVVEARVGGPSVMVAEGFIEIS